MRGWTNRANIEADNYSDSSSSLRCGRKSENSKRTHADEERTCKLYTERPRTGFKPRTFLVPPYHVSAI